MAGPKEPAWTVDPSGWLYDILTFCISPKNCCDGEAKPKVRFVFWGTCVLGSGRIRTILPGGSTDAKTRGARRARMRVKVFMVFTDEK